MSDERQKKLIRDNYIGNQMIGQPLGMMSLEASRSMATYNINGSFHQDAHQIINANSSIGEIQNNDLKRNMRMIKLK